MKRNEIQSAIERFIQSNTGEFTAQEIKDNMQLQFSVVTVRYHLDYLVMKSRIKSITSSRPTADGRNHKAVVYFK